MGSRTSVGLASMAFLNDHRAPRILIMPGSFHELWLLVFAQDAGDSSGLNSLLLLLAHPFLCSISDLAAPAKQEKKRRA